MLDIKKLDIKMLDIKMLDTKKLDIKMLDMRIIKGQLSCTYIIKLLTVISYLLSLSVL